MSVTAPEQVGVSAPPLVEQLDKTIAYLEEQREFLRMGRRLGLLGTLATVVLGNETTEETRAQLCDVVDGLDVAVSLKKIAGRVEEESGIDLAGNAGFQITDGRDRLTVELDEADNLLFTIAPAHSNGKTSSLYATYLGGGEFADDGLHVDGQYVLSSRGAVCQLTTVNGKQEPVLLHSESEDGTKPASSPLAHYLEIFADDLEYPLGNIEPVLPQQQRPTPTELAGQVIRTMHPPQSHTWSAE